MAAAPVPAVQVHDWLMQNIASLEHISEKTSTKENGSSGATDQDVAMTDASTVSTSNRGLSFIEGISKSSYVKHASESSDFKGFSVKISEAADLFSVDHPFQFQRLFLPQTQFAY